MCGRDGAAYSTVTLLCGRHAVDLFFDGDVVLRVSCSANDYAGGTKKRLARREKTLYALARMDGNLFRAGDGDQDNGAAAGVSDFLCVLSRSRRTAFAVV